MTPETVTPPTLAQLAEQARRRLDLEPDVDRLARWFATQPYTTPARPS